jgi:hypothetical protein
MPVILVVSSPTTNEGYWVSVKSYFKHWGPGQPTTITFARATQRFTKDSLRNLMSLAAPKAGFYLAPPRKVEKLHSNLLHIDEFPERIYFADTECRWPSDVWALLRKTGHVPNGGWVLKGKRLISFHDLSEIPWTSVCDKGTVEGFPAKDWADSDDPEQQHLFVQLLNQTLRAQLNGDLRYWTKEECFAFVGEARKVGYQSLQRRSRIAVVSQFSSTAKDGRVFEWRRHLAFRGMFRRLDDGWYLQITPTYRFTRDGFELERFHEDRLKGIKQLEGNRAVLSCVLFWADFLRPKSTLFAQDPPPIRFGNLLMFDSPVGINDKDWGAADPEFAKEAERNRDSLLLPDLEDFGNS